MWCSVGRSASSSEGVVGHAGLAEARSVGAGGAVLTLHQGQVAVGVRGQPVFFFKNMADMASAINLQSDQGGQAGSVRNGLRRDAFEHSLAKLYAKKNQFWADFGQRESYRFFFAFFWVRMTKKQKNNLSFFGDCWQKHWPRGAKVFAQSMYNFGSLSFPFSCQNLTGPK